MLRAVRVIGTAREAALIGARSAGTREALLGFRTRSVEAGHEAVAIDANTLVSALEIELTAERGRIRFPFEGVEAQAVVCAGRTHRTFVFLLALAGAAKGGTKLTYCAVGVRFAEVALRRRLRVAFVPPAQEAAALAQGPVGDAEIAGVPVTAGDSE